MVIGNERGKEKEVFLSLVLFLKLEAIHKRWSDVASAVDLEGRGS